MAFDPVQPRSIICARARADVDKLDNPVWSSVRAPVSLPKIPPLFIYKGLHTIADSRKTTRNDTIIRKSWSR